MTTRLRTKSELEQEGGLMEAVCEHDNLKLAYQRVVENKGSAGVDGIGVAAFKDHALAGAPGGHCEAARRNTNTRHSDADGSYDPASVASGAVADLRSGVLGGELRLSTGKERPSGDPLLSNILLTELDRELESRGHAFCRYADDCNIYVRTQSAGERVMASITPVSGGHAQAHGDYGQERGGAPVGEEVSGLQHDVHRLGLVSLLDSLRRLQCVQ